MGLVSKGNCIGIAALGDSSAPTEMCLWTRIVDVCHITCLVQITRKLWHLAKCGLNATSWLRPVQVVTNAAHVQHTQLLEVLVYILCNLKLFDIFKRPIDSKNVYMEEMML